MPTALEQYAIDTNQVSTREIPSSDSTYQFLVLNSLLYRANTVTGQLWRLDKGKTWVLIEESK